jgi:integrase
MHVGQHIQRTTGLSKRDGHPVSPQMKAGFLTSSRAFFRDCQEWEWIPRRFDPTRALATPASTRALIGPNPRVIADDIWAKLLWAGLNIQAGDLSAIAGSPCYPMELVRAITLTWLFGGQRSDEIVRLRVGCIRWLTGLTCGDVHLGSGPHVSCHGKGRKERITPLTKVTVAVLRVWLAERHGEPRQPLFPNRTGGLLSRDAVEKRLALHLTAAAGECPSLKEKAVTAHTLRHTAAMRLLHAGVDTSVIALWLGHEQADTTQIYLHADLELKEKALAKTTPANTKPGRYKPPDQLLAFLESL